MADIITIIILLLTGFSFIIGTNKFTAKRKRVLSNGVTVEGIIFQFDRSRDTNDFPVIRFTTKDGIWITEPSDDAPLPFLLKQGQKVSVTYNFENPKEFIFTTKNFDFSKTRYLFIGAGIICLIISLWLAYRYLTKQH